MFKHCLVASTLVLLGACAAGQYQPPPPDTSQATGSVVEFLAYQERLRADIEDGVIGNLLPHEERTIFDNQALLVDLLTGVEDISQLPEDKKIQVLNAQEMITGVLVGNVDDTPICRRERRVGTHRAHVTCLTTQQRDEQARAARNSLREIQKAVMPRLGDG